MSIQDSQNKILLFSENYQLYKYWQIKNSCRYVFTVVFKDDVLYAARCKYNTQS